MSEQELSIRFACECFSISESGYRYNTENERMADWLLQLTQIHNKWSFGLCFLYLRNVKGFCCNHKHVHNIYRELELILRIKLGDGDDQLFGCSVAPYICDGQSSFDVADASCEAVSNTP